MSYTVHTIVVGVSPTTNIQSEINKMMTNLKSNIENNNMDFIEFVTKQTMYVAKLETKKFAFRGDLERGIAHRVFKGEKRGEVFIKSDQQQKAIMNEFGAQNIQEYNNIPYSVLVDTKLRDWARQKAPRWVGKPFIVIGKPASGSRVIAPNPKNRFWGVTQAIVEKDLDNMYDAYLTKIIESS